MEETVLDKISQLWPQTKFCQCDECRIDVAAYALNRLPPRYVHSLTGVMLHKFDANTTQTDAEITATVYQAMEIIGSDPHKNSKKSDDQ